MRTVDKTALGRSGRPSGVRRLAGALGFVAAYVRANLSMAMEYRGAFVSQVGGMVLNDAIWVFFWGLFFRRFESVGGWGIREMFLLYAVLTGGFGLALGIFGNCARLAPLIATGQLDYYLALPKNVLLHTLVSRTNVSAWGDFIFSFMIFAVSGLVSWGNALALAYGIGCSAAIIVGFGVLAHSLSFWIGNSESLAAQLFEALLAFSSYPTAIFKGLARLMLFTVIPAGFISAIPIAWIVERRFEFALGLGAFSAGLLALAAWVFRRGLARYESGNLIAARL